MVMPVLPMNQLGYIEDDGKDEVLAPPNLLIPFEELPVFGVPPPDRKWTIDMIVRELDNGQFTNAGRLGDSILRDGRIMGAMEQRNAAVFGCPLELEPADESELALKIRDEIEEGWESMFPRDALEEMHQYSVLHGVAIVEKIWDTSKRPWTFRIAPYHPSFYTWIWRNRSYYLVTLNQALIRIPRRSSQWMTYTPYGYKRSFLRGRLRALVDPWMMRNWNKNDWAHWCEIHGKPIRKAIVPQQAKPAQEREFVNSIANLSNNTTIKVRQDKDGNKYDVELLEAVAQGWKGFEAMMHWCDQEISQVLLGQAMSTDGVGGLGAQEKPGQAVRQDVAESDNSKLCEALEVQALRDYCEFNYGNPDLAPCPRYRVEPPEDEGQIALKNLNQANADALYIQNGVVTPEEVAMSRFGGGDYSLDTEIDVESRKRIQEASIKQLEQEAQNELEAANDPAPTPGEANKQEQAKPQQPGQPQPFKNKKAKKK